MKLGADFQYFYFSWEECSQQYRNKNNKSFARYNMKLGADFQYFYFSWGYALNNIEIKTIYLLQEN